MTDETTPNSDLYLVWSQDHGQWRGDGMIGVTASIQGAGRFARQWAIEYCAMTLFIATKNTKPDLPIREADALEIARHHVVLMSEKGARNGRR